MYDITALVAVAGGILALLLTIIGVLFIVGIKVLRSGRGKKDKFHPDEGKIFQEIHHGLQRMEERVEALETLMLDREKKGERI
jgi:phage shock protein B